MTCTTGGWSCVGSPIIVDPQDEGFHLTSLAGGVVFPMAPGHPMRVAWTDGEYGNGFLALDRNGNGKIDDGSELFGEFTPQPPSPDPNGYRALAVFDDPRNGGNGNGRIDPGDAIYPRLRIWIDRNHNGVSEPNELVSLPDAGVAEISLSYFKDSYSDQYGNQFRYRSLVWDKHGHADPRCYDVYLRMQPAGDAGN